MHGKKTILFVCTGNTCRSPMAKGLLEYKLKTLGKLDQFVVESAASSSPTYPTASEKARRAIEALCGEDILATHKAKLLTPDLVKKADLILVMSSSMKAGLPPAKTWTLKQYAASSGDVKDPFGGTFDAYLVTAHEISTAMDGVVARLIAADR